MTLYEFNCLKEDEKTAIMWSEGDFVANRKVAVYTILLYQVHSFYVEVYYAAGANKVSRLRSFSNTDQLEPYLEKINIAGLIL